MNAGEKVGSYELIECILFKTMHQGEVWLAKKEDAAGLVEWFALKLIPISTLALDEKQLELLKAEARLWHSASKGNHENIARYVETIEYDSQNNTKYLVVVSEYAADGSLQILMEDRKNKNVSFTSQEIKSILGGVLAGLVHVHSKKIFHRDLKPANIVFSGETPKIIDFGISRMFNPEHSQVAAGTPYYMAPEAFDGERDVTVDIWSVGVMFYYLVVGRLPFAPRIGNYENIRRAVNREDYEPLPENIPAEYKAVVDRSLDKVPSKRFRSAAEMREAIQALPSLPTDPPELQTTEQNPHESVITVEANVRTKEAKTPQPSPVIADKASRRSEETPLLQPGQVVAAAPDSSGEDKEADTPRPSLTTQWLTSKPLLIGAAAAAALIIVLLITRPWSNDGVIPLVTQSTPASGSAPKVLVLATSWKDLPVLSENIQKMAKEIEAESNGEVQIIVKQANEAMDRNNNKIEPLKLFDAVANDEVQMAHTAAYYHKEKIPAAVFFSAIPFGMNKDQMNAWLEYQGGMDLWRDLYSEYKVIPFACGSSGQQWGGWFNNEIRDIDDFKNLRMRIAGLGGDVVKKLGVTVVPLGGPQISTAKTNGEITAAEWIGPYPDWELGLYKHWQIYYKDGWQEPNALFEFIINKKTYDALSPQLKAKIEAKTREYNGTISTAFFTKNKEYEAKMRENNIRIIDRFPASVISALRLKTAEVLKECADKNDKCRVIGQSYENYRKIK